MIKSVKRYSVYLDPDLHRLLKLKAVETSRSVSDLVNEAVRQDFRQDQEDLQVFEDRAAEPTVSYEQVLKDLKAYGKISD